MTTCCIFQCIVLTERGFSHINFNLCKSDLHNRLSVEHTSQLMTVKLNGLIFMSLTSKPVFQDQWKLKHKKLECGPMPNLMVALPNIGGALCSTPQSLADAHY